MKDDPRPAAPPPAAPAAPAPPAPPRRYEPPRILKRRSVQTTTLFSGSGPNASGDPGLTASG